MYPFQAAEAVIKESVEPLLEDYRPPGITSLKFNKLSLGTVAPKIEGNKFILLFFDFHGNPNSRWYSFIFQDKFAMIVELDQNKLCSFSISICQQIILLFYLLELVLSKYLKNYTGIRVQSLKKGQITMDIDLRWGGDPNIILGVEAAMVASIPIQVDLCLHLTHLIQIFVSSYAFC